MRQAASLGAVHDARSGWRRRPAGQQIKEQIGSGPYSCRRNPARREVYERQGLCAAQGTAELDLRRQGVKVDRVERITMADESRPRRTHCSSGDHRPAGEQSFDILPMLKADKDLRVETLKLSRPSQTLGRMNFLYSDVLTTSRSARRLPWR